MNSSNNPDVTPTNASARQDAGQTDTTRSDGPAHDTVFAQRPNSEGSDNQPIQNKSRLDPTFRAPSDQDPTQHDAAGLDPSMHDTSRQGSQHRNAAPVEEEVGSAQPIPPENWLDIAQAEVRLRELGVSRTTRSIQRFCKKGTLQCRLVPTENGSRYIINERSIKSFVERFQELLPGTGFGSAHDDEDGMANPSALQKEAQSSSSSVENLNAPNAANREHVEEIVELKDEFITVLKSQLETANKQIAMKDEQISEMLERDHETNYLIQNLQRMIGLPEGHSSAYQRNGSIDADHRSTNAGN